jgi:LacI family transcriptional regulator
MGDHRGDWYSQQVIQGIDAEAADRAQFTRSDRDAEGANRLIRVELYGTQGGNVRALSQRLMASRPDVLACVLTSIRDLAVAAEAQRLGIPVIGAGYRMGQFGLPTVLADDAGGAALAVNHLLEHGHTRIGCLQLSVPRNYILLRHEGYRNALEGAGIEYDESLVCWLTTGDPEGTRHISDFHMIPRWRREIRGYLKRARPTALVVSNGIIMEALAALAHDGEFRIPTDLSLVTFDQTFEVYRGVFGELRPTVIALPWIQFGRQLVRMACDVVEHGEVSPCDPLPCQLLAGDTVLPATSTSREGSPLLPSHT